jgi:CRISPR/Cas system-associated exonuclease Cas4 (RecB family)
MVKIQPAYVEIGVTLDIFGQEFQMYLDVIDENDVIHDTKTSGSKYSESDIEKNTQLAAYALGFRKKFGRKEKGVQLDVVVKTKEPQIQVLKAEITDDKISRLLNSLENINKGIEQQIFHPVDNSMVCSWCDFKEICDEDNNLPDAKIFAERLAKIVEVKKDNLEKI